ncbi:hypothetical protein RI129_006954 [Pyrocoelia pectoralis]|uniref:Uncharacterized protein n=1 Tax=Pyrocoelia pectoralis TaxID=417401 RepID=A0AAN7VFN9_9COLE
MQFLVLFGICVQISYVLSTADVKSGANPNTIPVTPRPEMYYVEPSEQPHTNYIPVQVIPKPIFLPQQPATMLIIAQPTYMPQHLLYGNPGTPQHQLLNYFHTNPQAKYQLLYGSQPSPTVQSFVNQNAIGPSTLGSYEVLPHPLLNQFQQTSPTQFTYGSNANQFVPPPLQLNQISQLAHQSSQQFGTPIRSVPPIITGFENFTPEQQSQIKAQLRAHLGSPLATTATIPTTTTQSTQKSEDKNTPSTASYSPAVMYRGQYTKG